MMSRRTHTSGMSALRTSRFTRFVVVPLTLLALFSGCYTWSVPGQRPADYIRDEEPSRVRLHLMDGREFEVSNPTVTNGDISGFVNDTLRTVRSDEVFYVEHRSTSAFGWAGLGVAVGALVLVVALIAYVSADP